MAPLERPLNDTLQALGIIVFPRELAFSPGFPNVSWDDDLDGFLDAARALGPIDSYVIRILFDEKLIDSLNEEYGEPGEPDLELAQAIIEEARALFGQEAYVRASFVSHGIVHQYTALALAYRDLRHRLDECMADLDDAEGNNDPVYSAFRQNREQWLSRLYDRLVADEDYLTGRNEATRGARVEHIVEDEFGSGQYSHSGWHEALVRADAKRKQIVEQRKANARELIPVWAIELARLPAFQAARSQIARRSIAKNFLSEHEPLAVNGEFTALLEECASRA